MDRISTKTDEATMLHAVTNKPTKHGVKKHSRRQMRFYALMIALPVLQFVIFYIVVNFNSILLAFEEYNVESGGYVLVGWTTFKNAFGNYFSQIHLVRAIWNSLLLSLITLVVGIGGAVFFSFYIYKKYLGSKAFKVFLFLPSVISSVAMVLMFRYFVELGIPEAVEKLFGTEVQGLISNDKTGFATVMFFSIWVSFGPLILMFSGAMTSISPSVVESAQIDGITPMKELWFITLPLIWETFVTYVVVTVAGTFINQMHLFSFFSGSAEPKMYVVGYYLYCAIYGNSTTLSEYPVLSAQGIMFTVVTIPATFLVRYLMRKFGPKEV